MATPLLAPMPQGDGPKRAHLRIRRSISQIARRVAIAALLAGKDDVLAEVYAAGIAHAVDLSATEGGESHG